MIEITPLKDELQLRALYHNAQEDGHLPLYPSHLVTKQDEIVGYLSLARMPIFLAWLHTQKINAHESYRVLKNGEKLLRDAGHSSVILPCAKSSPFFEFLPRLNYQPVSTMTLHIRNFNV